MASPRRASEEGDVTQLLRAWRSGDELAGDTLFARLYGELRRLAAAQLRGERVGHTLVPTAVVHEAYLRLLPQRGIEWRDRAHFFGLAATMMRRVLVDHARSRSADKRRAPDGASAMTLGAPGSPVAEILDLDRALTALAIRFERPSRVVEMRYFAGLDIDEIAECLEVSPATVKRDWRFARAWLAAELSEPSIP